MPINPVTTIQLRRGLKTNLPATGALGEPFFCTDTNELFIWNGTEMVSAVGDISALTDALATTGAPVNVSGSAPPTHAGEILISQPGNATAVWADPLVQGLFSPGTVCATGNAGSPINPVLIGGQGADGKLYGFQLDASKNLLIASATPILGAVTYPPPISAGLNSPISVDPYGRLNVISTGILNDNIVGQRQNQIEVNFSHASFDGNVTNALTGTGLATQTNGQGIYSTGASGTGASSGVSNQNLLYRAGADAYAYFSAAFTMPTDSTNANYQRIGPFTATDGLYIGFEQTTFNLSRRRGSIDTHYPKAVWADPLDGSAGSKFTRSGTPEAINWAYNNVFRIRWSWFGGAPIQWEVLSPDGYWVVIYRLAHPNTEQSASFYVSDLAFQVAVGAASSSQNNIAIYTACWGAGMTMPNIRLIDTVTDNSLATLGRSAIIGVDSNNVWHNVGTDANGHLDVNVAASAGVIDPNNTYFSNPSTYPALSAGETFTGVATDVSLYQAINIGIKSDVSSAANGFQIQFSADGTNWDYIALCTYIGGVGVTCPSGVRSKWFRIVYTNGAVDQTYFRLNVDLLPITLPVTKRFLQQPPTDDQLAVLGMDVLIGQDTNGNYHKIQASTDGSLNVNALSDGVSATSSATWTAATPIDTAVTLLNGSLRYSSLLVTLNASGTFATGRVAVEGSNDGSNWFNLIGWDSGVENVIVGTVGLLTAGKDAQQFNCSAWSYLRVHLYEAITGGGSPTVTVGYALQSTASLVQLAAIFTPIITLTSDGVGNPISSTAGALDVNIKSGAPAPAASAANAPAAATVGVASAQAVAANASRKGLILTNTSSNFISLAFGPATAAVLYSGITLVPYGIYEMDDRNFTTAAVFAIASGATSNLGIQEWQ